MKGTSFGENLVYRDFFTFTAVAWFTGGVVSPLTLSAGQTLSLQIIIGSQKTPPIAIGVS
jgi:hypothetical protein